MSTDKQEKEGTSLDTQIDRCQEWAREHGYLVPTENVYRESFSGAKLHERPQLDAIRELVRREAIRAIIFYAVDRLTRETAHLYIVKEEADRYGVSLECVTEPFDNSAEGELLQAIKGYVGKIERAKILERTLRAKEAQVRAGKHPTFARKLFGYDLDSSTGMLTINAAEAAIVAEIFSKYVEGGQSLRSLAAHLDSKSVSPKGARWTIATVRLILRNPAYYGKRAVWNQQYTLESPKIVEPDLWKRAQALLAANQRNTIRRDARQYLLSGFVRCGRCGQPMKVKARRGVYVCASTEKRGESCHAPQASLARVERIAWAQFAETITDESNMWSAFVDQYNKTGPDPRLVTALSAQRAALAAITKKEDTLVEQFASGDGLPPAVVKRKLAEWAEQRTAVEAEIAALEQRQAGEDAQVARIENFIDFLVGYQDELASMTLLDKRRFLQRLNTCVLVLGSYVQAYGLWTEEERHLNYSEYYNFAPDDLDEEWGAIEFAKPQWRDAALTGGTHSYSSCRAG